MGRKNETDSSRPKRMTEDQPEKFYADLLNRRTHGIFCNCPACLFVWLKFKNKKTRIDVDNFFLLWIRSQKKNFNEALSTYQEITREKPRADQGDYLRDRARILSRIKKKVEISNLVSDKWTTGEVSPYLGLQAFEGNFSLAARRSIVEFAGKTAAYLTQRKRAGERITRHRDILRRYKKMKESDLLPVLEFMEANRIISWNRREKKIRPRRTFEANWFPIHMDMIREARDEVRSVYPKSLD